MDSSTPLWQLTLGEFTQFLKTVIPLPETEHSVPEIFGMDTLAELTTYSKSTLYKKIDEIPHYRRGGKLIFDRDEINIWLRENKILTHQEKLNELKRKTGNE